MLKRFPAVMLLLGGCSFPLAAQRGAARTGPVTFAIVVKDAGRAPITDLKRAVTGPVQRNARTEGGRLVFENLPTGDYTFRFEKTGYGPVEEQVTGRGARASAVPVATITDD